MSGFVSDKTQPSATRAPFEVCLYIQLSGVTWWSCTR